MSFGKKGFCLIAVLSEPCQSTGESELVITTLFVIAILANQISVGIWVTDKSGFWMLKVCLVAEFLKYKNILSGIQTPFSGPFYIGWALYTLIQLYSSILRNLLGHYLLDLLIKPFIILIHKCYLTAYEELEHLATLKSVRLIWQSLFNIALRKAIHLDLFHLSNIRYYNRQ